MTKYEIILNNLLFDLNDKKKKKVIDFVKQICKKKENYYKKKYKNYLEKQNSLFKK